MLLPSLNSVLNPFIYLLLNRNLLYTLLKMIGANCVDTAGDYRNETTNQRLSISMHKTALVSAGDPVASGASSNSPTTANNSLTQSPALANNVDSVLRKHRLKRITSNQSMKSETTRPDQRSKDGESDPRSAQKSDRMSDKFGDSKIDTNSNNKISINLNANRANNHNTSQTGGDNAHKVTRANEQRKVETVASLNQELNRINVECLSSGSGERMNGTAVMQMTNFNLPRIPTETNSLTLTTADYRTAKDPQQFVYQSSSSAPDLKTD